MIWALFIALVLVLLAVDLLVLNRIPHTMGGRESLRWTSMWVSLALLFGVFIYQGYENGWMGLGQEVGKPHTGMQALVKYLTGYLIELSLSMDNIFVIALIFTYFKTPSQYQHRVLFWGILGAIVFRIVFILLGVLLIENLTWISYLFGLLLLYGAWNMWRGGHESIEPAKNPILRTVRKFVPVTKEYHGEKFFIRRRHVLAATPLFVALVMVETTDIMFAVDSIPAIFAITTDPFLVFSSNIFAILGLRSMYFVLAAALDRFAYLKWSLILILAYVGVKMMLIHHVDLPEWLSFAVVTVVLGSGVVFSLTRQAEAAEKEPKSQPKPKIEEPSHKEV